MRLLQEKKSLLTKLIHVQQQETKASLPASQYIAQHRANRSSDTYSVASGSTGVSYATFNSSSKGSQAVSRRSGPVVPRLNLSR